MVMCRVDEDFKKFVDEYRKNLQRELGLKNPPSRSVATKLIADGRLEVVIKKRRDGKKLEVV